MQPNDEKDEYKKSLTDAVRRERREQLQKAAALKRDSRLTKKQRKARDARLRVLRYVLGNQIRKPEPDQLWEA